MTKTEVVEAHRHEIAGYVMDAVTCGLTGAPLAMLLREMMKKIDQRIGKIYDDSQQAETKPVIHDIRKAK